MDAESFQLCQFTVMPARILRVLDLLNFIQLHDSPWELLIMSKLSPYAIPQGDSMTGVYTDAYFHHVPFQQIEQCRSKYLSLITLLKQVGEPHPRRPYVSLGDGETPVQLGVSSSKDSV